MNTLPKLTFGIGILFVFMGCINSTQFLVKDKNKNPLLNIELVYNDSSNKIEIQDCSIKNLTDTALEIHGIMFHLKGTKRSSGVAIPKIAIPAMTSVVIPNCKFSISKPYFDGPIYDMTVRVLYRAYEGNSLEYKDIIRLD
ncbi:MAG: hypothetical protein D6767_09120 [Candidatus Hydrogenedentota bacterium]|nr:MAG: hypothetical protein D6767_09120 [Candidatus Hydrogenedentota bacterium]